MGKIKYCLRCGRIEGHRNWDKISPLDYCTCSLDLSMFDRKEKKKAKLVLTDYDVDDWPLAEGQHKTVGGLTQEIYEFFWETYIDIPTNENLNRETFEANKTRMLEFFRTGPIPTASYVNPSAQPKDASVVGRAVAGAVVAGPTGAIVGAASAIDKKIKNSAVF